MKLLVSQTLTVLMNTFTSTIRSRRLWTAMFNWMSSPRTTFSGTLARMNISFITYWEKSIKKNLVGVFLNMCVFLYWRSNHPTYLHFDGARKTKTGCWVWVHGLNLPSCNRVGNRHINVKKMRVSKKFRCFIKKVKTWVGSIVQQVTYSILPTGRTIDSGNDLRMISSGTAPNTSSPFTLKNH